MYKEATGNSGFRFLLAILFINILFYQIKAFTFAADLVPGFPGLKGKSGVIPALSP